MAKGQSKLPDASVVHTAFNIVRTIKWVLFYVILVLLLSVQNYVPKSVPKLNEVARFDVVAPYSMKVIDEKKTEEVKEELIKSVRDKYKLDKSVMQKILSDIENIFSSIKTAREDNQKAKLSDDEIEKRIEKLQLSFNAFRDALSFKPEDLEKAHKSLNKLFENIMSIEIPNDKIQAAKSEAGLKTKNMPYEEDIQKFILDLFEHNVRPNYVYDKEATQKQREKLVAGAVPVERHIKEGEIIVRHGEIIKNEHIEMFTKFNFYEAHQNSGLAILSSALISFLAIIVVIIYLIQNKNEIFKQEGLLTMMALIVLSILAIAKLVAFVSVDNSALTSMAQETSFISPYIVPIAAAAILIALLVDIKLAFIINIIVVIFVEMILGHNNLNFLIVNIMSGTVAILNVKNVNHRTDLTKAGIMVSFTNIFLITAYALLDYDSVNTGYRSSVMKDAVWGFFNGFISAIFAIGLLPYLESVFKVSTSMRLLELSDLNQALLRRLLLEAPGTYHHSMIVGNLAEAAAKDIGADALLCRVGAYYHDIGKLKRPLFFIENQNCGRNVHDNIKPHLSARAIMSHTKDGYEIGLEYQLPQEILDIIIQHHGTNLITYFFSKALNAANAETKDEHVEEEYRYAGPRPQNREAAIILLADAIEAASRTLTKPSVSNIDSLVKRIKNERFNDGQFDDCNITLKDLEKISATFVKIIAGMYHSRIEYPAEEKAKKHLQHPAALQPEKQESVLQQVAPEVCNVPAAACESAVVENDLVSEKKPNEN